MPLILQDRKDEFEPHQKLILVVLDWQFKWVVMKKTGLVVFNSISTLVGYLMPNPVYTYIYMIYNHIVCR